MNLDPKLIQTQRWYALQSVARSRKIDFFSELTTDDVLTTSLQELITLCDTLESILHAPPGR